RSRRNSRTTGPHTSAAPPIGPWPARPQSPPPGLSARIRDWRRPSGGSSGVLPRTTEQDRAVDDPEPGIGLRVVAPQLAVLDRNVLAEQARMGAAAEHLLEDDARLLDPAVQRQRLDVPEGAEVEGGLRLAEVVRVDVAEQIGAALQVALDRLEGLHLARIAGVEEAQVGHLQQGGVQFRPAEAGGEATLVGQIGLGLDALADDARPLAPHLPAVFEAQVMRRAGQAVAGRPAHDRGIGVHAGDGAELPQAGVDLIVHGEGAVADLFQSAEILDRAGTQQALIEEGLNQRQDDLAI